MCCVVRFFYSSCCSPRPPSVPQPAFMRFAERHRRLVNALVHHKPQLLQTSLALLLRAPKLLDFDNVGLAELLFCGGLLVRVCRSGVSACRAACLAQPRLALLQPSAQTLLVRPPTLFHAAEASLLPHPGQGERGAALRHTAPARAPRACVRGEVGTRLLAIFASACSEP